MWDCIVCRYIKSLQVWYTEGSGGAWPSAKPSNLIRTSLSLSLYFFLSLSLFLSFSLSLSLSLLPPAYVGRVIPTNHNAL